MVRYVIVSFASGILFGVMDGVINGNPLARNLYRFFEPVARKSINVPVGFAIDLAFGFAMAGIFLLISRSLPGPGLLRGVVFGTMIWFLRVVMNVASQWMMFSVPPMALVYTLALGFVEMLVLGVLYGVTLTPSP